MANLKVVLELDNQGYIRGIKASEDATKKFAAETKNSAAQAEQSLGRLGQSAEKLVTAFTRMRNILIGAAFVGLARNAIASADAIDDLARATETTVGRIIELQRALQASGGEAESAGKLITEFYKSIEEAAGGSDKTQEAFAKLGVSLKDLATLPTDQLLQKTLKGFDGLGSSSEKTALAIQLFGKSMMGVSPETLASQLEALRGKFDQQTQAVQRAAELQGKMEEAYNNLKLALLTVLEPIVNFINKLADTTSGVETLTKAVRYLGIALAAAFGLTVFGKVATLIGSMGRGLGLMVGNSEKLAKIFNPKGAFMNQLRTAMKFLGLGGAAVGAAVVTSPDTPEAGGGRGFINPPNVNPQQTARTIETGKELQSQVNAVKNLVDGYRRAAQANMDRYQLEVDLLGKTEDEVDLIKGRGEIEKRYADQIAALEQKKQGAKGSTLALITKSIEELKQQEAKEIGIFETTRGQITNYRQRQEEIRRALEYSTLLLNKEQEAMDALGESINTILTGGFKKMRDEQEATANKALPALQRRLAEIAQEERNIAEAAKQRVAAQFENDPQGLSAAMTAIDVASQTVTERRQQQAKQIYDQQRSFTTGWEEAFNKYAEAANDSSQAAASLFETSTRGMEDAIVKFAQTGKLSFRDLANSIIADIVRVLARRAIASFFGLFGDGGAFISGVQKFAQGGIVTRPTLFPMANGMGLMGEAGPEAVMPLKRDRNGRLGVSSEGQPVSTNVVYNINAVDAASFRSLVARDPQFIYSVTEAGRRAQPSRRLA